MLNNSLHHSTTHRPWGLPSSGALAGVPLIDPPPTVGAGGIGGSTATTSSTAAPIMAATLGPSDAPDPHDPLDPPGAAAILNLLPHSSAPLSTSANGVYMGEGLHPVSRKLAGRIR